MGVTIFDVARLAKVSKSTISRYFTQKGYVSESTRINIEKVIKKLNYYPNILAANLARGKTSTVGLLVSEIKNPFASELVQKVEELLTSRNYRLILFITNNENEITLNSLKHLYQLNADGIICGVHMHGKRIKNFVKFIVNKKKPFVSLGRIPNFKTNLVQVNTTEAVCLIIKHMINSGRRRIVCMAGNEKDKDFFRINGWKKAHSASGLSADTRLIVFHSYLYKDIEITVDRILSMNPKPDAIFAFNDYLAMGIIAQLLKRGIQVPGGIAVAGIDNIEISDSAIIPLTTVDLGINKMANAAVDVLLENIEAYKTGKYYKFKGITIQPQIVLRQSC
jgi:DNA-binding LacI/PurR family transcriptional regulator